MENKVAKAYLRYVRIAPRKVQIVCDLIRGKDAGSAMAILMQTPKAASEPLQKLLKSAVATSAWTPPSWWCPRCTPRPAPSSSG